MKTISSFFGKYRFLSNFYPANIFYEYADYSTVEHAFQAAKTFDLKIRTTIGLCRSPGDAKRYGRDVKLREDWEDVKLNIMRDLVLQKFTKHLDLRLQLLKTINCLLVEGNTWGDMFWGVCKGVGENHLGKILMSVREELSDG